MKEVYNKKENIHYGVLISILVPVYNRQEVIEECLLSILGQSYTNIEIVVYDDGSTDNTVKIIKSICSFDRRVRLIEGKKNRGVSYARSQLIQLAQGDWICFCDSDDFMCNSALKILINAIEKNDIDVIIFRMKFLRKGYCIKQKKCYIPNGKYNIDEIKKYYLKNPINLFWCSMCNKCYKAKVLKQNIYFRNEPEDVFYNIEVLKRIKKVLILSDYLYLYNQKNESLTRTKRKDMGLIETEKSLRRQFDILLLEKKYIAEAFGKITPEELQKLNGTFYKRYRSLILKFNKFKLPIDNQFELELLEVKKCLGRRRFFYDLSYYFEVMKFGLKNELKICLKGL